MTEVSSNRTSEIIETVFHNVEYSVIVTTINEETLSIEVEQQSDFSRWRGDFTSRHVEDMTSKTGNFKKFLVFIKMLLSALKQSSDSVFVDLLTYQDLEALKNRKAANAGATQPPNRTGPIPNKRYLILTYAAEFDRVHYPLPLLFDEPDVERLKQIINKQRGDIERLRQLSASSASTASLESENRRLKDDISSLRTQLADAAAAAAAAASRDRNGVNVGGVNLASTYSTNPANATLSSAAATAAAAAAAAEELQMELKQTRRERDALAVRVEAAETEIERAAAVQRREIRRKAKELQEALEEAVRYKEQVR
eukprot:CAMPEP_0175040540 /NCGR_PEP_ID=MMETSP0052_2-20121109/1328_1 /TAXON_ID=51329 ORGANISM="Polytomella parva, Strain SAG 63-3" /NCGR_SAMPLE_ID=MMETSP0052_2 /ASSEMBLY_ACC=CAM_ASM_000194 /LENGTH=311 /DNA_ID=CAMNT_0016302779 /DNA_START=88 /DNA_END=1019 /DNA_ORIENTATION=+